MIDNEHVRSTKDLVGRPVEVRVLFRALYFLRIKESRSLNASGFFVLEILTATSFAEATEGQEVAKVAKERREGGGGFIGYL